MKTRYKIPIFSIGIIPLLLFLLTLHTSNGNVDPIFFVLLTMFGIIAIIIYISYFILKKIKIKYRIPIMISVIFSALFFVPAGISLISTYYCRSNYPVECVSYSITLLPGIGGGLS